MAIPSLFHVALFATALGVSALDDTADICSKSATGLSDGQLAVTCYSGNFLTKMLGELNQGQNKTAEHVRVHLLPYLGGNMTLAALQVDSPDDPTCTVCYTDKDTSVGLTSLRNSLTPEQITAYDSLGVCYARLTEAIMLALPKSPCGVWLRATPEVTPYDQVLAMMKGIFGEAVNPSLCPQ
eukprot:jgi/Bigna1/89973/estExt_fgenesh1_pg.C_590054